MRTLKLKRMGVWALCAVLLAALLPAGASEYPFIGYTTDDLRLRQKPSTNSDILLVMPGQEALVVTGEDGDFYIVAYEGHTGYALKAFITREAGQAAATPPPADVSTLQKYAQLSSGDTGITVKALQQALKELYYYSGSVDSKYGSGTAGAVRSFQEKNSLPINGIADPVTQELLYEGKPVNAFGRQAAVDTLAPVQGVTIRPGARGDGVEALQTQLKALGLYTGPIDGKYGLGTENAVRAFQGQHRLKVDGIAGKETQAKLLEMQDAASPTAPPQPGVTAAPPFKEVEGEATYPYTTTAAASVNMRKRASVSSSRILTVPRGASIRVIRQSGDFLFVEYRNYQGYVMAQYIDIPPQYLPGETLDISQDARVRYETLTTGSEGSKVRALQQAMTELGFYTGAIDGKYGTQTMTSVKAWQQKNNLRETGIALPELQQMLYEKRSRGANNRLVSIKTLPPVEGWPMELGNQGDAVLALHQVLKDLGHYNGDIVSVYSRATADAVRAFQKQHSIKVTGKVDNFTHLALRAAAATPAPDLPGGTPAPTELTEWNVVEIRSGTRGLAVTRLQERLVALGYYAVAPDGIFDSNDIAALKAFQKNNGLTVSGVADLGTQRALYAETAVAAPGVTASPAPAPTTAMDYYPVTLRIGLSGEAVRAMQTRLIALQYLKGKADGIFGTATAAAVTAFQRANGLKADGLAGKETLGKLYGADARPQETPKPTATPSPTQEEDALSLAVGDTGQEVVSMQLRLITLQYLTGGADGIYGPKTALAVRAFQSNNNLNVTGSADYITLGRLYASSAKASSGAVVLPSDDPQPGSQSQFRAPAAREVRFANWYAEIRSRIRSMPNVVIYDFISGQHYFVKVFSVGRHADGEPVTKQDTEVMEAALGKDNWTPRPVWVIFTDGRVYMGSTHSRGHDVDHNPNNGLTGHICIHFPRDAAEAAETGPYAVSHQSAILAGWDLTQNMIK
ncbi:MAG: peptidoglycan-binding protein [Christensenellales bacterium]|jgi:peptidoglycan hydrolase-like protein with peptidoglycan-binding domain